MDGCLIKLFGILLGVGLGGLAAFYTKEQLRFILLGMLERIDSQMEKV